MPSLASFRNRHSGETVLVCGCSESLNELSNPERFITIGVNDVGRRFDPNYLVVVNPRAQFARDRFDCVATSRAEYIFTQYDSLGISHPNVVKFSLGNYGGTNFSNPDVLHYSNNPPYVALCLAVHMGAKRIGLIGVDFTDHHFFAATGRHPLVGSLPRIDKEYRQLGAALAELGMEIVNLSRQSRLTAFPKCDTLLWQNGRSGTHPMDIVSYATAPVAGVPAILARCIVAETSHRVRCVGQHPATATGWYSLATLNGPSHLQKRKKNSIEPMLGHVVGSPTTGRDRDEIDAGRDDW